MLKERWRKTNDQDGKNQASRLGLIVNPHEERRVRTRLWDKVAVQDKIVRQSSSYYDVGFWFLNMTIGNNKDILSIRKCEFLNEILLE